MWKQLLGIAFSATLQVRAFTEEFSEVAVAHGRKERSLKVKARAFGRVTS